MSLRALVPLLASACIGCMNLDNAQPIALSTHVQDWRDEVIYQIVVDRFANGDAGNDFNLDPTSLSHWHGGDWQGVEDHLDYIQALGVTTLWISPVVKNVDSDGGFAGYHGYWTQDLTAPNPHFGDVPALRRLVAAAHQKGLKVILDIVTNHLGQLFYYDINMNGQPDDQVQGGGCDKWDNPADTSNLYPDYSSTNPTCVVLDGQAGIFHLSEMDPQFSASGPVQASSSLGYAGPAPIVFLEDLTTNQMPPLPRLFQDPEAFNRRGGIVNYSIGDQLLHGDFPGGFKDLATTRCDVKQALVDVYATWVETADFDGFRIDTVKHVEPEFWRYFSQKVRSRLAKQGKTNFFMFGEAFDGDDVLVGSFTKNGPSPQMPAAPQDVLGAPDLDQEQSCVTDGEPLTGDMLDSVFYFPQYYTVVSAVLRDSGATTQIEALWNARQTNWGSVPAQGGIGVAPASVPVNFLDNHDVGRFLFSQSFHVDQTDLANGVLTQADFDAVRKAKLQNALVFLFTERGIPSVYYGDEQGFEGGNAPANREDLWGSGYVTNGPFFLWIQKLAQLRKSQPALTHGDQRVVWATDHTGAEMDAGIFAFERSGGDAADQYALIVLNTNRDHPSSPADSGNIMKVSAAAGTTLVDILSQDRPSYTVAQDGSLTLEVPALAAAVLVPQGQATGD
jgi:glycosidase